MYFSFISLTRERSEAFNGSCTFVSHLALSENCENFRRIGCESFCRKCYTGRSRHNMPNILMLSIFSDWVNFEVGIIIN